MQKVTLAIIAPNENLYSETFIRAHRELLDANIKYLFEQPLPEKAADGTVFFKRTLANRMLRKVQNKLFPAWLNTQEKAIGKYFEQHKVQVVLAEYGITGVAMMKVCRRYGIPLIVHFHGFDAYVDETLNAFGAQYQAMFRHAYQIVVVSSHMYKKLLELGCPPEKMIINTYGPSKNFASLSPGYHTRNLLAVGRFVEKKAPVKTITAFGKIAASVPDATLSMVGDGPLMEACKQQVAELGLGDRVRFLHILKPDQIMEQYANAVAFVQHSLTAANGDSEGTPVAILEASLGGLPVIATRHAGIPDVILEGETGLLCDEGDIEAMAWNMERILVEDGLAAGLGQNGRRRILDNFTMERHIGVLNNLIKEAAASGGPGK